MLQAIKNHWPEYLMEAAGLGLFMLSAGLFGTLLEYPGSPVRQAIENDILRRALMGVAMGATAMVLIYYPWGQQSGAHYNPSVTLAFWRLGKIRTVDAAFYVAAQFVGGLIGVIVVWAMLGDRFASPPVQYVATLPGATMPLVFVAEAIIAGLLMFMVLCAMNSPRWSRRTGLLAGLLVALYITFEAPISGMSMNPARTLASALPGRLWHDLWIYFLAPPLGMQLALAIHRTLAPGDTPHCAKLNHHTDRRCIFCGFKMSTAPREEGAAAPSPVTAPARPHPMP